MYKVLLFGTSYMGEEYLKVLKDMEVDILGVVGRNETKAKALANKYQTKGYGGGKKVIEKIKDIDLAIVATSVESLEEITRACLEASIKNILVEKPGCLSICGIEDIANLSMAKDTCVRVAYNRRFYSSVQALKNRLKDETPVACTFDFTEWHWEIENLDKSETVKQCWVMSNSSHVIDTVFYLLGKPTVMFSLREGKIDWHNTGAVFIGAGQLERCPFNYVATWNSSGRWIIEIATLKGRYRLCPMEELYFLPKKSVKWEKIILDDEIDKRYKPGLFKLVKAMITKNDMFDSLPTMQQVYEYSKHMAKIAGYDNVNVEPKVT